jgi:hypothetical protein
MVTIALKRFEPMQHGLPPMKLDDLRQYLAEKHEWFFDEPTLSRAVIQAFGLGLVEITQAPQVYTADRDAALEHALCQAYADRGLRTALVVKTDAKGDELSARVAWAFADWLRSSRLLPQNAKVGVGAGLTIFRMGERIRDVSHIRQRGLEFISLTGRFGVRCPEKINNLCDADINAIRIGVGVSEPVTYWPLGAMATAAQGAKPNISGTWMEHKNPMPDWAIVEVGCFSKQWEFLSALRDQSEGWLSAELDRLVEAVAKIAAAAPHDPPYVPVGDVANHLFVIEPPPGYPVSKRQLASLLARITKLNSHILTATGEDLKKMDLLVAAAGVQRTFALHHVLEKYSVDTLATDRETAQALIDMAARAQKPSPALTRRRRRGEQSP